MPSVRTKWVLAMTELRRAESELARLSVDSPGFNEKIREVERRKAAVHRLRRAMKEAEALERARRMQVHA